MQLKDVFSSTNDRMKHVQILAVLPQSMTVQEIMKTFGVSRYFVSLAKRLATDNNLFSILPPKKGKTLSDEVVSTVKEFYRDTINSQVLPGARDTVRVEVAESQFVTKQRLLVLDNLKDREIGFTKFCLLRPKECVLAGASGTHTVCVWEYHKNFKFMTEAAHIEEEIDGKGRPLKYQEILAKVICELPSEKCFFGFCSQCPGVFVIQEMIEINFDIDSIRYIILC